MMREAVGLRDRAAGGKKGPLLEASGGITERTLVAVAESGVDRISIGAITHSAAGLDLSMEMG
jgi:nicotinate-nucleotide pyrophosphorylase (carboxylating)